MTPFRLVSTTALTLCVAGAAAANELRDAAKEMFAPLPSTTVLGSPQAASM